MSDLFNQSLESCLKEGVTLPPCSRCIHKSRPGDGMVSPRCQSIRSEHYAKRCSQVIACGQRDVAP